MPQYSLAKPKCSIPSKKCLWTDFTKKRKRDEDETETEWEAKRIREALTAGAPTPQPEATFLVKYPSTF